MHLRITLLGRELLTISTDTEHGELPHIEDHTGYPVGFVGALPPPSFVELPEREF